MTQEEKELLLKDLSARLFYGVKGLAYIIGEPCRTNTNIVGIINKSIVTDYESPMLDLIDLNSKDVIIKPYLRPLSSMTEEEKEELRQEHIKDEKLFAECLTKAANGDSSMRGKVVPHFAADWCNKNHFDYRGLIPMGLALEATEGMYVIK